MKRYIKTSISEDEVVDQCKAMYSELWKLHSDAASLGHDWNSSGKDVTPDMINLAQAMLDVVGAKGTITTLPPNNPRKRNLKNPWDYYRMNIQFTIGDVSEQAIIYSHSNYFHWEDFINRLLKVYYRAKTGKRSDTLLSRIDSYRYRDSFPNVDRFSIV